MISIFETKGSDNMYQGSSRIGLDSYEYICSSPDRVAHNGPSDRQGVI
jgi:hypothetical protein